MEAQVGGKKRFSPERLRTPQRIGILGTELVVSPNSRNSFTIEFAKAAVHTNGPSLTGFTVKYDYIWGKGFT